ncbi:MAG: GntR family transcriptional regulator [Paracoccaceae bacterium]
MTLAEEADAADRRKSGGVYERLREDIVAGLLAPGQKIKPKQYAPRYAASAAAIREALLRLAAEGFVESAPQRGFRTLKPSAESVWEIAHFRILIESEGARLSILNGGVDWEANLTAAHHRLSHLEARMRGEALNREQLRYWSGCDQIFHVALIAACGSNRILDQHRAIFDQFKQHVIVQDPLLGYRGEDLVEEHGAILTAALDRDPAACAAALRSHFETYRRFSDATMTW